METSSKSRRRLLISCVSVVVLGQLALDPAWHSGGACGTVPCTFGSLSARRKVWTQPSRTTARSFDKESAEHLQAHKKEQSRLSIVLVTSPVGSHPSTELVDEVIESFDLVNGLADCPLIVVGDGVSVCPGRPRWNKGKVDQDSFDKYLLYLENLRRMYGTAEEGACPGGRTDRRSARIIGPLPKRVNFAHALLEGLRDVKTEFVLVAQHDRVFVESFDIDNVLGLFDEHPRHLRYVGFQTIVDYPHYAVCKYGKWTRCSQHTDAEPGLMPVFMWYDSAHVCRTEQLARLIEQEVKPGEFIESPYGCRLLEEIQSKRSEWTFDYHMKNYGHFLYRDPKIGVGKPIVKHIRGRSFWAREDRIRMGWPAELPASAKTRGP